MIRWMQRAQCRVILSSYDREDIRQQVRDFTVIPVSFVSGMGPERKNREILITNFELPRIDPYWQQFKFLGACQLTPDYKSGASTRGGPG